MELGKYVRLNGRAERRVGHGGTLSTAEDHTVFKGNEMTVIKVTNDEPTNQPTNQIMQCNRVLLGKIRVSFRFLKCGN